MTTKRAKPEPANTRKHTRRAREAAPKKVSSATVARTGDGKFLKGVSGNPSGRPAIAHEIRELASARSVEALEVIVAIMRDLTRDAQVRIVAAKAILDRACGRPAQPVVGALGGSALININMAGGTLTTAEDAQAIYSALCADPSLDVSQLRLDAPAPAQEAERQPVPSAYADPLEPVNRAAATRAMWEKLGK